MSEVPQVTRDLAATHQPFCAELDHRARIMPSGTQLSARECKRWGGLLTSTAYAASNPSPAALFDDVVPELSTKEIPCLVR